MEKEYLINACSGKSIDMMEGQNITIVDVEGGQVADFFAECAGKPNEFLSSAVTIDCNESLRLNIGDYIYSNLYHPMFKIVYDEVGEHDLLFPCCRPEMYDFFYQNGKGHPNCYDNINPPLSKAGSKIILQAMMNVRIGIAACSVSESECNDRKCSSIKVIVVD